MEIHRPKPFHGWREFLKEVGVIFVGVVIALLAEQAAEALHHREVVRHGEDALRNNFARFVQYKVELDQEAPCMVARVAELRAIIDRAAVARRLDRIGPIPQPYARPWEIDTWDAMVASQAVAYLPHDRAVLYSRVAKSAADLNGAALTEWSEWGALGSLSGAPRPFSEAEEAKVRDTLARGVERAALARFIADRTVARIVGTGLLDQAALNRAVNLGRHPDHAVSMCQPISVAND